MSVEASSAVKENKPFFARELEKVLAALAWLETRNIKAQKVLIVEGQKPSILLSRPPIRNLKGTERVKIESQAQKRIGVFIAPVHSCLVTWTETLQ